MVSNRRSSSLRAAARAAAITALLAVGAFGCSSVGGSAVRTGPVQLPQYSGPVAVYAAQPPPADAVDLGVVEVHGSLHEGEVGQLLPELVRRVAEIGGNIAVVEGIRARFDMVARNQVETFYYSCGLNYTCAGTRVYTINDEVMTVSMFGRAMSNRPGARPASPLAPAPVAPVEPPAPPVERPPLLDGPLPGAPPSPEAP